jgi:cytochrome c556
LKAHRRVAVATLLLCVAGAAMGESPPAPSALQIRQAIEARKAVYVLTARSFSPLIAMAQGKLAFNAVDAGRRAQRVAFLAEMAHESYPPGSLGAASRATPRVWEEWADFEHRLNEFSSLSAALVENLKTTPTGGDGFRTKVKELNAACGGCHDRFRAD